ncbi:hypothetical protein GCM10009863_52500 [Streptomyces axinellae]|uniref:Uncharacterized protein n=1 Tax=Streptomyces axinellae TaxID=552788 RepID=A0ABN3QMN0_9ACTN
MAVSLASDRTLDSLSQFGDFRGHASRSDAVPAKGRTVLPDRRLGLLAEDDQRRCRPVRAVRPVRGRGDLFGDVRRALEWWRRSGRPRLFDFGITVTPEARTITLGRERTPVPSHRF